MGEIRIKHMLLFFFCVLCFFFGALLFKRLTTGGTLHHHVHIEYCRSGDKELLRGMPPDVIHYALRTPCWWAAAQWLLLGIGVCVLYITPIGIVFYFFKRESRK